MNDLLDIVEQHLKQSGLSAATFGREAMRDPNFVFELRDGRDYRSSTQRKVIEHIEASQVKKGQEEAAQ